MNDLTRPRAALSSDRSRILKFEGACNFRDLGGYTNRDGQAIRWGRVFRTGVLSYFTEGDHAGLCELGVTSICDLRREPERGQEPTRWPDTNTRHLNWEDGPAPPTIRSLMTRHPHTLEGVYAAMLDLYRELPEWMVPRLQGMFDRIAAAEGPVIVHCAAGKDRTGIAIALLLALLDVPRETIVADYLMTNEEDFERFITSRHKADLGVAVAKHPILDIPPDIRRVLFVADAEYLHATFETIERGFGDLQTFLSDRVGVDAELRRKIRAALLEKSDS